MFEDDYVLISFYIGFHKVQENITNLKKIWIFYPGGYWRPGGINDRPTFATFTCHLIIAFLDELVCIGD